MSPALLPLTLVQCQYNSWCGRGRGHPPGCAGGILMMSHDWEPRCEIEGCPYYLGHTGPCHGKEWRRRVTAKHGRSSVVIQISVEPRSLYEDA